MQRVLSFDTINNNLSCVVIITNRHWITTLMVVYLKILLKTCFQAKRETKALVKYPIFTSNLVNSGR